VQGIDQLRFMQGLAGKLDSLEDPAARETLLDELEYLMEVLDPEFQDLAEGLRGKLDHGQ
jgi:hypothetical protein